MSRLTRLRLLARARAQIAFLHREQDSLRAQIGGLEARAVAELAADELRRSEFKVFSQYGEDGIIQFLVSKIPIENDAFVEFGVGSYSESNTRFLLVHDNWRGLVIDAGSSHQEFLRASKLVWLHHIDAVTAFIDTDNINELITRAGLDGDIGLLSIDIDGNDYWIMEAIEAVSARILVVEYNSTFGPDAAITIPYDPRFAVADAHWSSLYFGASLAALRHLADRTGYALVGCNKGGNDAFFVRRDVIGTVPEVDAADAYVSSRFRCSRNRGGDLSFVSDHRERLGLIADLPVYDVETDRTLLIRERFGLD